MILWIGFYQVCEIYTHLPLPIFLFYYHGVSQPFRIENFLDSPCLLKFRHFLFDNLRMIFRRAPRRLFFGGDRWIDIQMVTNEIWIHPRSFISTLCERINISSKKFYQLFLLLRKRLSPDLKELLWIITYNNIF